MRVASITAFVCGSGWLLMLIEFVRDENRISQQVVRAIVRATEFEALFVGEVSFSIKGSGSPDFARRPGPESDEFPYRVQI